MFPTIGYGEPLDSFEIPQGSISCKFRPTSIATYAQILTAFYGGKVEHQRTANIAIRCWVKGARAGRNLQEIDPRGLATDFKYGRSMIRKYPL